MRRFKICLISFLRKNEIKPKSLKVLKKYLEPHYSVKIIIISDSKLKNTGDDAVNVVLPNKTKYSRIKKTFDLFDAEYYFCVDSDISLDLVKVSKFITDSIDNNVDISWGRIGVTKTNNLLDNLIDIDKILSHSIIRPALWKLNVAVTVPGQILIFKKKSLKKGFDFNDTFLDDLAIGSFIRRNISSISLLIVNEKIGYEVPSKSLSVLLTQRKRWAVGYRSLYLSTKKTSLFKFILIHAFSYHFLWVPIYFLLYLSISYNVYIFASFLIFILFRLADKKLKKIRYSVVYLIVFPFIHIWWFWCFLKKDFI